MVLSETWLTHSYETGNGMSEMNQELTIPELATLMGISVPTTAGAIARGVIPSHDLSDGQRGVWRRDAEAWLALRSRQAATLRELAQQAQIDEGDSPSLPSVVTGNPDREDE